MSITTGLTATENKSLQAILHLAAKTEVRPSIEYPAEYLNVNSIGTQSVLECMQARAIHKLIVASSSSVYGNTTCLSVRWLIQLIRYPLSLYLKSLE